MKYLIILFSLITFSIFGQSGTEPTSLQGTPYKGGILVGVTPIIDEFTGDTIYLYQHSDTSFVKIDSLVYTDSLRLYTSQGVFTTYVSGGGGLSGSGVATRVAFWSGTNTLSSNANLYWDDVNNRLGYKTSSPSYDVHLKSNSTMMSETANGWIFGAGGVLEMKGTNPGDSRLKWILNGSPQTRADLTIFPTSITLNHPSSIYNDFDFRFTNRLGDVVFNFKSADKRLGINTDTPDRELDVNGEVRIRDLTTTTPTKIMANDNDGVLSSVGLGTGINISGGNIVNTSPDQTVTLTGAGITSITGTYPNFTITSTEIGDIENVTVSAPIVGGGVSGGVNIAIDTTSSTGVATQYDLTQIDQLQTISTSGTAGNITLSDGGGTLNLNVNDADSDPANELQTISKVGSTVTLSNGGGSFTDAVNDADADPANEYNTTVTSTYVGNLPAISITDGGGTRTGVIQVFSPSSTFYGSVPGANGLTTSFLRGDGQWVMPPSSGITSLGGQTGATQTFSYGTNGTTPSWSSASNIHTFRLPVGTNGQVLKHNGTDWTVGTDNGTLSGTLNTIPYYNSTTSIASTPFTYGSNIMTIPTGNSIYFPGTATIIDKNNSGGAAGEILSRAATGGGMDWIPAPTGGGAFNMQANNSGTSYTISTGGYINILNATTGGVTATMAGGNDNGQWQLALSNDLLGVENITTNGFAVRTGTNTWATRSFTGDIGIGVANGTGNNNPVITLQPDNAYLYTSTDLSTTVTLSPTVLNFTSGNGSNGGAWSTATDRLIIGETGLYEISYSFSYKCAESTDFFTGVHVNGSATSLYDSRTRQSITSGNYNYVTKTFLANLTNGNEIDLRYNKLVTGSVSLDILSPTFHYKLITD